MSEENTVNESKENSTKESEENTSVSQGLFRYADKGEQTVMRFMGIELTAPAGLKNPGIVYLSFIVVNLVIFLVLRGFITK